MTTVHSELLLAQSSSHARIVAPAGKGDIGGWLLGIADAGLPMSLNGETWERTPRRHGHGPVLTNEAVTRSTDDHLAYFERAALKCAAPVAH